VHSSKSIAGSLGNALAGKRICLCVTGSVAAVGSVAIARELMRHGADVSCVMSGAAQALVGPDLLHWATGNPVVTRLSGECEHISLCGECPGRVDLVLVAPCTANTLSKFARGVDDTAVTTVLSTAAGSGIPIILVPAMHISLYKNPFVARNVREIRESGAAVIAGPLLAAGKARMPEAADIADYCARSLAPQTMRGLRALVTAGATREFIDDVRFISNPGTGKMGIALARAAWMRGADVTLVHGHVEERIPPYFAAVPVTGVEELYDAVRRNAKNSGVIVLAASAGDFAVRKTNGKMDSRTPPSLRLSPARKASDDSKRWNPKARLVLFKAESGLPRKGLVARARKKLSACRADLVVANDVSMPGAGFGADTNRIIIVSKRKKPAALSGSKLALAGKILDSLGC